jgi:hypothetical protein
MVGRRQVEILGALRRLGGSSEWGEVWDRVGWSDGSPPALQMSNFDRSSDALVRRGLIVVGEDGMVSLTADGIALLELETRSPP